MLSMYPEGFKKRFDTKNEVLAVVEERYKEAHDVYNSTNPVCWPLLSPFFIQVRRGVDMYLDKLSIERLEEIYKLRDQIRLTLEIDKFMLVTHEGETVFSPRYSGIPGWPNDTGLEDEILYSST